MRGTVGFCLPDWSVTAIFPISMVSRFSYVLFKVPFSDKVLNSILEGSALVSVMVGFFEILTISLTISLVVWAFSLSDGGNKSFLGLFCNLFEG